MKKVATGISVLDLDSGGGFPKGSLVFLIGPTGSGKREFAYMLAAKRAAMKIGKVHVPKDEEVLMPEKMVYITLSRSKESILSDMRCFFPDAIFQEFQKEAIFVDLSRERSQPYLPSWLWNVPLSNNFRRDNLFIRLAEVLDKEGPHGLVIIHTLSDLAQLYHAENSFVRFLKNLQMKAREWDGIIYALFSTGMLPADDEANIISIADGILEFRAETGPKGTRQMVCCHKFRGISPYSKILNVRYEIYALPRVGVELQRIESLRKLK
jgi:KaiC/GvpD/RAD55 family RecA-like ATPase